MKSSYVTNFILIIVIASLLWFSQQESTSLDSEVTLTDLNADNIKSIIITHSQRPEIKLTKQPEGWHITEPITANGNKTRIDLLLSLLGSTIHTQLSNPSDSMLRKLGLSPVKSSLKLNEQTFVFGDIDLIDKRRYVLLNGTVYLIDDQVSPLLNANVSSFIDIRLLSKPERLHKLQLPLLKSNLLDATSAKTISTHLGI